MLLKLSLNMHEEFQKVIGRVRCIRVNYIAVLKAHSAKYFQILYGILCHPFVLFFFFFLLKESFLGCTTGQAPQCPKSPPLPGFPFSPIKLYS